MTRKISLLLAIIMAFCSCIALSSCGGDPASENGEGVELYVFDYHISDDGSYYIVTGYGVTTDMVSTIPEEYEGKPIKEIQSGAFYNDPIGKTIEEMTLAANIEVIGSSAFYECVTLHTINFKSGLKTIGHGAFAKCSSLTKAALPEGLLYIDDFAFRECVKLESVTLPSTLTHLGANVFAGTKYLNEKAPVHNGNITHCPDTAFKTWVINAQFDIVDANLPDNTVGIASDAFAYCDKLTTLELPKDVKYISKDAFIGCTALTTVNYGGSAEDFAKIVIESGNEALSSATINFAG